MTRSWLLMASLALTLCACHGPGPVAESPAARRPNFLVLVTDDQRLDAIGFAGHPLLQTPHMDSLAQQGVWFDQAYVTTPICAASRASFLTGQWERAHGFTFGAPALDAETVADTYPSVLRAAGYRTGFVGKFGVKVVPGSTQAMFDVMRGSGHPYDKADGRHLTNIVGERAIEFLEGSSAEEPFCLSISFHAPHAQDGHPDQYIWPDACDELYTDAVIPPPDTCDPAFFEALPEFLRESMNRDRWFWRFDTPEKHATMVKGYYRMVSGVDMALGRILAKLEELELADNTVVLLMGDNGYFLGERGYAGKWSMHDLSTRVPFVIYDPRDPRARRSDEFVLNVDLAPSLLDYAGVAIPASMQGQSLRPLLAGKRHASRDEVYTEHRWPHPRIPRTEGLRTRDWKYIRYLDHSEYEELYDLRADPREEHNLAEDPQHTERLGVLRARCLELGESYERSATE